MCFLWRYLYLLCAQNHALAHGYGPQRVALLIITWPGNNISSRTWRWYIHIMIGLRHELPQTGFFWSIYRTNCVTYVFDLRAERWDVTCQHLTHTHGMPSIMRARELYYFCLHLNVDLYLQKWNGPHAPCEITYGGTNTVTTSQWLYGSVFSFFWTGSMAESDHSPWISRFGRSYWRWFLWHQGSKLSQVMLEYSWTWNSIFRSGLVQPSVVHLF